jgi:hypothetical protein
MLVVIPPLVTPDRPVMTTLVLCRDKATSDWAKLRFYASFVRAVVAPLQVGVGSCTVCFFVL